MRRPLMVEKGTAPLSAADALAMKAWIERDGEVAVAEEVGLSRHALTRSASGLAVHAGTRRAVLAALAQRGRR
jgi:hypothetical protein